MKHPVALEDLHVHVVRNGGAARGCGQRCQPLAKRRRVDARRRRGVLEVHRPTRGARFAARDKGPREDDPRGPRGARTSTKAPPGTRHAAQPSGSRARRSACRAEVALATNWAHSAPPAYAHAMKPQTGESRMVEVLLKPQTGEPRMVEVLLTNR